MISTSNYSGDCLGQPIHPLNVTSVRITTYATDIRGNDTKRSSSPFPV
jgi:hypothetical protein